MSQESPIFDLDSRSTKNPDSLYLSVAGIPPLPKRTITKKIYFSKYDENYEEDKDILEVDSDRDVGPFFDAIAD